jgi:iron complex transport system ATP-binding protein
MSVAVIEICDVTCKYDTVKVLEEVNFKIRRGSFTGIIGPNGSGKSTLLKIISKALKPNRGTVWLNEQNIYHLKAQAIAQQMAVVPQETVISFPFLVKEVVMMGRSPYLGLWQAEGKRDYVICHQAMQLTNTLPLANRPVTTLSGGEKQRVIIAQALTQEPEVLLLDEPTSHLDINHQLEIMELLQRLNQEQKLTIVAVFHDLNLAAQYCDQIILLHQGKIYALGKPEEVLIKKNIQEVYQTKVLIEKHSLTGRPYLTLLPGNIFLTAQKARLKNKHIHVICGGGAGTNILRFLVSQGYTITAGVLNKGDVDLETAKTLDITVIEEAPFMPVSQASHCLNLEMIQKADACLVACIPFGHGNIKNLEAVAFALEKGKPVFFMEENENDIALRDYTEGKAEKLYQDLIKKGAYPLSDTESIHTFFA